MTDLNTYVKDPSDWDSNSQSTTNQTPLRRNESSSDHKSSISLKLKNMP